MLLIGPPGSGKTHWILERLEAAVREGRGAKVRLVTPTQSMARHLAHELARRGLTVPGDVAMPIRRVVEKLTPELVEPQSAVVEWLLGRAVEVKGERLGAAAMTPGGLNRLARAVDDLEAARVSPDELRKHSQTPFERTLAEVYAQYEQFLQAQGFVSAAERRFRAAEEAAFRGLLGAEKIYFDGFFDYSPAERDLVQSLATSGAEVFATATDQPGPDLFPLFKRKAFVAPLRPEPQTRIFMAPGLAEEVSEIARRILEARRSGRLLREIGVVVRSPENYATTIQAVFERYGIPFRMRRPRRLSALEPVAFLRDLLRAAVDGFPGEATVEALARPASRIGASAAGPGFLRRVGMKLPGARLELLESEAGTVVGPILEALRPFDGWRSEQAAPVVWRDRLRAVSATQVRWPEAGDGLDPDRMLERRAFGTAWAGWLDAIEQTAELLRHKGRLEVGLAEFVDALDVVLRTTNISIPDARRDVVNVLSAHEARQWELPVVFVCGMVEGWFPQSRPEESFVTDRLRRRLRASGLPIRTQRQFDDDERFLYRIATTRASEELVLSRPELDAASAPLARSFFLPQAPEEGDPKAVAVAPQEEPAEDRAALDARITDPSLHQTLTERFPRFSPSGLNTYQRCPFEFFAGRTLRLEPSLAPIPLRLDAREKGTILHDALAIWSRDRTRPIGDALDEAFKVCLDRLHLPATFRTEMAAAALRADLERFASEDLAGLLPGSSEQGVEDDLEYVLDGERTLRIGGRIDRYESIDGSAAVVIDYKSGGGRLKKLAEGEKDGSNIQGSLYLAGLRSERGLQPGGMLYIGLRRKTGVSGWLREDVLRTTEFPKDVHRIDADDMEAIVDAAERRAARCAQEIRAGNIAVEPSDPEHCRKYCDFRDVCRVEL